jgi:hypothetical protein
VSFDERRTCPWCGQHLPPGHRPQMVYDTPSCKTLASRWRVASEGFWTGIGGLTRRSARLWPHARGAGL